MTNMTDMLLPDHIDLGQATSLENYVRLTLEKRSGTSERPWIFRGHRDSQWLPIPQIDRPWFLRYRHDRSWTRRHHEERLLNDFERGARPHVRVEPRSSWEWLAVAQHHGLATRLLDWTANPLAALYFATEAPRCSGDSAVWCYHHEGESWIEHKDSDPFDTDQILDFQPPHLTSRITVQGGSFTSHPDSGATPRGSWPGDLRRITIPHHHRHQLRDELRRLGVDRASLFPDLDGIAFALNRHLSQGD